MFETEAATRRATLAEPILRRRASGVLCHPTSLPGVHGIGDLGPSANGWIEFLERSGQSLWQVLPLGPPGAGESPYQALSAFAGYPLLLSLERLAEDGWLEPADLLPSRDDVLPWYFKPNRIWKAFERFESAGEPAELDQFRKSEAHWLDDWVTYAAIKDEQNGESWLSWPEDLRRRRPEALLAARVRLERQIRCHEFIQWQFRRQWLRLRAECRDRGIALIGDIPIYVAEDSAEVWARRDLFLVDEAGRPTEVAGVPPDYFSKDGQLWGNPLYDWATHESTGFEWWTQRLKNAFANFDAVRLDHFIGFHRAWAVPSGARTAVQGRWILAPGQALFTHLERELGPLPVIAEDLGFLVDEVRSLRDRFGYPGMKVLQFGFSGGDGDREHLPWAHTPNSVVYTGTHDNDTVLGWSRREPRDEREAAAIRKEREFLDRYLGGRTDELHWQLIRVAMASVARTVIVPLQDLLGLGSEARMNRPGEEKGNWSWRVEADALTPETADRLRELTETFGRSARPARSGS